MAREGSRPAPSTPSGQLADGTPVDGPVALRKALLKHPEQFVRTMTEKLLTYALGRGLEYYDMPVVRAIARDAATQNYRFSSIVLGIVKSTPFQMKMKARDSDVHRKPAQPSALRVDRRPMFITKKHLPRRTFLHGVGATLALPLLDAMVPARTLLAQTAAQPARRASGSSTCRTARSWTSGRRRPRARASSSRRS